LLCEKGIICALYNFCITDNQGVPLLKVSPSGKGYTTFVLLPWSHKGVYTNSKDLCLVKEGIQSPIYKGFYSREEAEKTLELNNTDINKIKKTLELKPTTIIINPDPSENLPQNLQRLHQPKCPWTNKQLEPRQFKKDTKIIV